MSRLPEHDRRLMLSFVGTEMPATVADTLAGHDVSGVTLFRPNNYDSPDQLRELIDSLQRTRSSPLPLLVAIDQEGGQLHAFGSPATMWAGNMALGAVDDPELTARVGAAIGRELRSVGINVNYAPDADLATNPMNPATGGRSFGEDPERVASHVAAMVRGIQSAGVAATVKHFPGKGDASVDSHHGLPVIRHDRSWLERHEFVPFRAAIDAGVKVAMTGHFALPAITGSEVLPCTLAVEANTHLLREDMRFDGVMITDALDMRALEQGAFQLLDIVAAVRSGVDLLLLTADAEQEERASVGLELAASRRLIDHDRLAEADARVQELRSWVAAHDDPDPSVVGCGDHRALAEQLATRSITLLANERGILPIVANADTTIVVIEAIPTVLTPADTSHYEQPTLADEVAGATVAHVEHLPIPYAPTAEHITNAIGRARDADVVVVATAAANLFPGQAELVRAVLGAHERTVVVGTRTPWDLVAIPEAHTYLCAWSVHRPSMRAAARAMLGLAPVRGRCPVTVGSRPVGSGIDLG